ncbi:glycerol-3-phosphate 1-O-acyltransferase PlsY [Halalkalibacterium halodurans]|jgi:glycerol-3-phosphate acyltransferase PlsY|uniref:Glycerol-3-phosphate acyltransferase n=3 Tax=Halalkalibacterium halodurans TaxID=86665 RepID=PLSY_HALH5|nr:glycerol-3-phosphate 1-O-acyltransferase PlsY [Halalkalibacterium halodurans]Q9KCD3.1 RecName: Full=Glycerol-3-phosphate acyltransferase; AltName: Full=Acyl-PO4 G3P acyltransferase; AltName: Full=Acyl-phosphate--glycerol-3-phosphate acyltransferase; AltName: Full=G3P acyltransferase; Short=GPAT; AltName: Full=Lysophosphatidic acid synthase; Short=LPA synthase [Halalkalibacterium halodurans C-125]MDY7222211.1 glycerol-3-phosphate 1-O-acyltransferase PlsY [Halalkalibacterium halodurans]MDY72414
MELGWLLVIGSYLLGSVSFSYIIAKKIKKVDIRQHGSGNAGATNTLRVLGVGPAVTVLLLDILKGVIAVVVTVQLTPDGDGWFAAAAGIAAIIGHNWPIYYGFRGGKGVATTIGVLASLVPLAAVLAGVIAIGSIVWTRYVSLGSLLFVTLTALLVAVLSQWFGYPVAYIYLTIIVAILSMWRHRSNIQRLLSGTENKLGRKKETT